MTRWSFASLASLRAHRAARQRPSAPEDRPPIFDPRQGVIIWPEGMIMLTHQESALFGALAPHTGEWIPSLTCAKAVWPGHLPDSWPQILTPLKGRLIRKIGAAGLSIKTRQSYGYALFGTLKVRDE